MYHHPAHHLDSPPPNSQLRRPWSPDPLDPLSTTQAAREYDDRNEQGYWHARREASDVSIEALDLADYAQTLRQNATAGVSYPSPSQFQDRYPPRALRQFPSRESLVPPSLVSDRFTASSQSHATSSHRHRPFSLPSSPHHNTYAVSQPRSIEHAFFPPRAADSHGATSEIDISQFPAWSRNWYAKPKIHYATQEDPDFPTSSHPDSASSKPLNPWDPNFVVNSDSHHPHPHLSYLPTPPPTESNRDILPWSADPPEYGPPLDPEIKEERIRMLQAEFGPKAKGRATSGAFVDGDGKPLIGTVDDKGNLVTQGPKKRTAFRFLQIMLALGAAVPSIYVALTIKLPQAPPPAAKAPAFTLYAVSSLTSILLICLFVLRPCCSSRSSKHDPSAPGSGLPGGLAVLPVQGIPGKDSKKGKKDGASGDGVQVNLIVDPGLFSGDRDRDRDHEYHRYSEVDEHASDSYTAPGGWSSSQSTPTRRRGRPRRSFFEALAQENRWREARAWLKKLMLVDILGMFIWGGLFALILVGNRCPIGQFDGWCTGYNVATAASCLLCVAFGVSTFFDIKDLHDSRVSPRTR